MRGFVCRAFTVGEQPGVPDDAVPSACCLAMCRTRAPLPLRLNARRSPRLAAARRPKTAPRAAAATAHKRPPAVKTQKAAKAPKPYAKPSPRGSWLAPWTTSGRSVGRSLCARPPSLGLRAAARRRMHDEKCPRSTERADLRSRQLPRLLDRLHDPRRQDLSTTSHGSPTMSRRALWLALAPLLAGASCGPRRCPGLRLLCSGPVSHRLRACASARADRRALRPL